MIQTVLGLPGRYRRALVIVAHYGLIAASNYMAFWLRFDGQIPANEQDLYARTIVWLLLIRGFAFYGFRLNQGVWRYAGVWDLKSIVAAVVSSTATFYLVVERIIQRDYPRSIFVTDSILLVLLIGGLRLLPRIYQDVGRVKREKRLLIVGAGDAGERILRDIQRSEVSEYEPVGFIDDDEQKVGRRIHGIPVLGTRETLPRIMEREKPHQVLVAMPGAPSAVIRSLVSALEPFKVPITTLPRLAELRNDHVTLKEIRSLEVSDLLPRAPVGLSSEPVRALVTGKRVLVTGAGGSIGSELCRQIAALQPSTLVLYERYENGLYAIASDLHDGGWAALTKPALGDVTDRARLNAVLEQWRPQIVLHAAAHKHVPLMELNPCEAVKNNIAGTRILAEAAEQHDVERFILVSTDKAVNPTSVMGATKRVAELYVQTMAVTSATRMVTVRFGNVLGSNGSVVLRFQEQITAGGPVTVTDPEIRRFFMLIPEAVQLVLHAAALAEGGETFVLEMGEQIRVVDLARNLIRLSGFVPDEEIPIRYVGLRPGEKLFEELAGADETMEPSSIPDILQVRPRVSPDPALLAYQLVQLEDAAEHGNTDAVIRQLCQLVPNFQPGLELASAIAPPDAAGPRPTPVA